MRVTAESTSRVVSLNGEPARIWEATTKRGVKCFLFVTRVAVAEHQNQTDFERDLVETRAPSREAESFEARMVL